MSESGNRELITAKDIQALGFGECKAERMYTAIRKAKRARMNATNPDRGETEVWIFVDDLVAELGIARDVILRHMAP